MPKVMIAPAPLATIRGPFLDVLRQAGFQLVYPKKQVQMVEQDVLDQMGGISACLAGSEPYTHEVFEALPDLKVIARAGVGYDAVDVPAATEHGVVVAIAPGTNQHAVAEHCFMLILALAKNLLAQHLPIVAGKWPRQANLPLRGRTLGLVGLGRIGKAMTQKAIAFGMNVVAFEPFPDKDFIDVHKVRLMSLEQVLRESDYVSLHMPLTPETKGMINRQTLSLMKPTAYLINSARGPIINEADLYEALKERRIAGAGLDVFCDEPPGGDCPLLKLDNVVLTAHTAGVDVQSRDDMAYSAASAIAKLSQGEWPAEQIVNPEVRSRFKWK